MLNSALTLLFFFTLSRAVFSPFLDLLFLQSLQHYFTTFSSAISYRHCFPHKHRLQSKLDANLTAKFGGIATLIFALVLSLSWRVHGAWIVRQDSSDDAPSQQEHALSGGAVFSFILYAFGWCQVSRCSGSLVGESRGSFQCNSSVIFMLVHCYFSINISVLLHGLIPVISQRNQF